MTTMDKQVRSQTWLDVVHMLDNCDGREHNLGHLLRDCWPSDIELIENALVLPFRNHAYLEQLQDEIANPVIHNLIKAVARFAYGEHLETLYLLEPGNTLSRKVIG